MTSLPRIQLLLLVVAASAADEVTADPRTDYLLYCRGCHLANGQGVPPDVPTLVGEIGKLVSMPGGREYIIRVPGVTQTFMNDRDTAAVLNWILYELNGDTMPADFEPYTSDEVRVARSKVLTDPVKYKASLVGK